MTALTLVFICTLFIGLVIITFIMALPTRANVKVIMIALFFILYQFVLDKVG